MSETQQRDRGVVFPLVEGARSTTATGRAVFADAARAVDGDLSDRIARDSDWRRAYVGHVRRLVEAELRRDAAPAAVPGAGLDSLHARFVFLRDGETVPVRSALEHPTDRLHTVEVAGRGGNRPDGLQVPYRGQLLAGDRLHRQLDRWVQAGTVEPSFAEAVREVVANDDWLDLSDRTVIVAGAGAEMGPFASLCRWGATVIALDLPGTALWGRVLAAARDGHGRVYVPVHDPVAADADDAEVAAAAGVDLVTELPEAASWLARFDGQLTLGNYVYADGAMNVRVSVAVDALTALLCERRADLSLAVLASPTDVFAVPEEVVAASRERFEVARPLQRAARLVTGGRLYAPNHRDTIATPTGRRYGVADAVVPQQGPNYLLAKRVHRWRARLARTRGHVSSINVAPPTRTRSVTSNRLLAAAYAAAPSFGVEIFEPETSRTLMAALLVHDLRNAKASAHPEVMLGHPLELLTDGAAHGGLWRIPFAPRSVLALAALRGLVPLGR